MAEEPQTILVVSSATSATGSIWRACLALSRGRYRPITAAGLFYESGRMAELRQWVPPERGAIVLINAPQYFNLDLDFTRYRLVLNARDPRDLLCNQYHWRLVHPHPGDAPGDLEKRAAAAQARGIDAFVLGGSNASTYKALREITRRAPSERWMFLGYAMWCLEFDAALARLAAFLGTDLAALPAAQRDAALRERTPDIAGNPQWIGQQWAGADTAPGRHRRELRPDTIATLTERCAEDLQWLREVDDPRMADLYR